jgi:hypothetical protein
MLPNLNPSMTPILTLVAQFQAEFRQRLQQVEATGGLTLEQYARYLSMQFHLTQGVQRHFFRVASHSSLASRGKLREFLIAFGIEEEMHYRIAKKDLENLGQTLAPMPLDVKLWWAYFDAVIDSRPLLRLGATCILENLGPGSAEIGKRLLQAPFINDRTSRFMQIHLHEELPHGDQVLDALAAVDLNPDQLADLAEGAITGGTLYLRMVDAVFGINQVVAPQPVLAVV